MIIHDITCANDVPPKPIRGYIVTQFHSILWIPYTQNSYMTMWSTLLGDSRNYTWWLKPVQMTSKSEICLLWIGPLGELNTGHLIPTSSFTAQEAMHWKSKASEIAWGPGRLGKRKITSKTYYQQNLSVILLSTYSLLELPSSLRQRRLQWERSESQGRCKQSFDQSVPLACRWIVLLNLSILSI